MRESEKAREKAARGDDGYALRTVRSAAAAVEREGGLPPDKFSVMP
jgi:hypothetical protein